MVRTRFLSLPALLLTLAACQAPPAEEPMMSAADIRAAVDEVRTSWFEHSSQDDAAGVAALYASDATLVAADGTLARGPAEIEAYWAQAFPVASGLESEVLDFRTAGHLAYEAGTYTQTVTLPDMDPMTVSGNYAVVCEQQADGSWKITMHVSSQHPPTM